MSDNTPSQAEIIDHNDNSNSISTNQAAAENPPCKKPKTESITTNTTTTTRHHTGIVTILDRGPHHVVVFKPHSVICHHSMWSGSKSRNKKNQHGNKHNQTNSEPEAPMLQRVREVVGQRVNLIHRLDRGASGCLLLAIPPILSTMNSATVVEDQDPSNDNDADDLGDGTVKAKIKDDPITSQLIEAHRMGQKTYLALVRGEGILHGQDFKQQGWFSVDRPIKDEKGNSHDALTWFRFVAGQGNNMVPNSTTTAATKDGSTDNTTANVNKDADPSQAPTPERARASLVLARPQTGRWHQIRKHLNGLSHPILGDGTHGNSPTNREWKEQRGLLPERICLHLLRMQIPPNTTNVLPNGLHVTCPVPMDLWTLLEQQMPDVLQQARTILEQEEGIILQPLREDDRDPFTHVPYQVIETYTAKKKKVTK